MKPILSNPFFLCIMVSFAFCSCFNSTEKESNMLSINEQELPCCIKCNNIVSDTMNILPLEVSNQFYKHINRFEGEQFNIVIPMPETWAIEFKLPSFSPDFDIWIVSNTGESILKLLVTITTNEIPTIIQALPIAYNMAIEKTNYIESEFWSAEIDNSYHIAVTKKYERLYSITEESAENKSNSKMKTDDYLIELNGKISYQKAETFDVDYLAIVQFADTSVVGALDEDWVLYSMKIQEQTEPLNILFVMATSSFERVEIKNYHGDIVDIVDISSFINKHDRGYLALKKGEKMRFLPYATPDVCLQKIGSYFQIDIPTQEEDLNDE